MHTSRGLSDITIAYDDRSNSCVSAEVCGGKIVGELVSSREVPSGIWPCISEDALSILIRPLSDGGSSSPRPRSLHNRREPRSLASSQQRFADGRQDNF